MHVPTCTLVIFLKKNHNVSVFLSQIILIHLYVLIFNENLYSYYLSLVTRYKMESCNSLEPVYVSESWADPGGDDDTWLDEGGKSLFDSPRRSSDRSPPFSIQIDFNQYRRNREYQGYH